MQGTPQEIEALLHNGGADIGIASERLSNDPTLAAFPWFRWHHSLLVPKEHPLTQVSPLTLEAIRPLAVNHLPPGDHWPFAH
ncbi:alkanesulfonate utilization operon LysR-family regulator CbI [Klebsiella pneumoniae]|uniref:Alkanesulfonate utilization operon LysR-family regulator CbI n=1 Tax=Klebsiella pneumoniae TaxID=573 RepID=A0A2X3FCH7_KLEPN|nr:alkanesulfonate utilization operon LysR-family regulator CbI [Klebsiella pneumoniae]